MTTTTASPGPTAAAKGKTAKGKTIPSKARATTAKFASGTKILVFNLRGLRLASFVKDGEKRAKGKIVEFAGIDDAQSGFADVCKKAVAAGWDNVKQVTSIDDLIAQA